MSLFAKIPYARIFTTRPILVAWLVFLYGMVLLIILGLPKRRGIVVTAAMLALCIALDAVHSQMYGLEISVLNVGQGACMVVRSKGKTAIIDCGGNLGDVGNIAADYLESVGARKVDVLILTHLHSDHINGLPTLLDRVPVGEIYLPEEGIEAKPEFPYTPIRKETTLPFGASELMLVPSQWQGGDNEVCMSVICVKDQFSFITMGDLSMSSERWLTRWLDLPEGGILLAGHHGSASSTSAEFLEVYQPQATIISVGRNTFGHPTPEVLERLEEAGSQVYRTDINGHVVIRTP
jgi:competence protein ComEC